MTSKTFIYGLLVTFAVPWLALLAVPSYSMSKKAPPEYVEAIDGLSGVFVPKRNGNIATGFKVYQANGCAVCHTQLIRTTDASGSDMWRTDWAGAIDETGDSRRETRWWDFLGEDIAPIGYMRVGPDLSNLAVRISDRVNPEPKTDTGTPAGRAEVRERAADYLYLHLFNPRDEMFGPDARRSCCDAHPGMFEEKEIGAGPRNSALPISAKPGHEWVPTEEATRLVSYLLSLDRDDKLPQGASYKPKTDEKEAK